MIMKNSLKIPLKHLYGFLLLSLTPAFLMFLILWIIPQNDVADRSAKAMRGFTNMWFAGHLSMSNVQALSNFQLYQSMIKEYFGSMPQHIWGYPPSMLLIAWPVSLLPIKISYILWTLITVTFLWLSTRPINTLFHKDKLGFPFVLSILTITSPAVFENILSGQTGAFAGNRLP